ncbi:recombination protein RecT [Variovorax sp. HW608]|uniref:recombinase RecT n=1 Tax=Variovorax sp. HW608 TaxID=1034889 RepID=UPI00081F7EC8|nr:recombinase RecT [Variovorax sp. HW608]SCK49413.1 recombination protein RecT [Variovorax sp. HW608]
MPSTTINELRRGDKPEAPPNSYEGLKRQLEGSKHEFLPLLGSQANVDAFVRVVLNAVLANPALTTCNRRSLIAACMKSAMDGLMPDAREAVLNVYNTKVKDPQTGRENWVPMAQYLPMVGGMIKGLYESGLVSMVDAAAVFEKDRFLFRRGDAPVLEHEPTSEDDPGRVKAAYVVVRMTSGELKREVMFRRDIEAVRAVSKSGTGEASPWVKWYDQQAIKSVIKRAAKQLPRMDRLDRLIAHDNEAIGIAGQTGLGDIVAPAAPGVESLAFDPSPTVADLTGAEVVKEKEPVAARTSRPRPKQSTSPAAEGPAPPPPPMGVTYAQLEEAMNAAPDRDVADQVLDRGRELPDVEREDLARLYETRFSD